MKFTLVNFIKSLVSRFICLYSLKKFSRREESNLQIKRGLSDIELIRKFLDQPIFL